MRAEGVEIDEEKSKMALQLFPWVHITFLCHNWLVWL
jgi:hypothetical protein